MSAFGFQTRHLEQNVPIGGGSIMAGSFSDYLENAVLDFVFGDGAFTSPATVYISLFTVAPTDAGGGTEVPTATWSNYSRVDYTNNATNFPAASGGAKSNGTAISFGAATSSGPVTVVAVGIHDADTAGNLLAWADLTTNKTVNNGDSPSFAIGELEITLT
jgi:hypothetical protein